MTIAKALTKNIIIFDYYYMNIESSIQESIMIHSTQFEPQCICSTFDISTYKFNAEVYAWHSGYHSVW